MNRIKMGSKRWIIVLAMACLPFRGLRGDSGCGGTNAAASLAEMVAIQEKVLALLERAIPCTVKVDGGSGVVVDEEGRILTVAHVGRTAGRPVRITFPDGKVVKGQTLGNNAKVDAGVARTGERQGGPCVPMGDSDTVKPGDWCVALGYPITFKAGEAPAVRIGRVLAVQSHAIVADCTIMGGDSGGPLFNLEGEVIGIGSRASGPASMNIFVPVNEFSESWDKFLAGTDWSGCRHDEQGQHGDAFLGIGPARKAAGAAVVKVIPGSPAEAAGLQAGDIVTRIDGVGVSSYAQILPVILRRKPGDELPLNILRGEKTITLQVKLGETRE